MFSLSPFLRLPLHLCFMHFLGLPLHSCQPWSRVIALCSLLLPFHSFSMSNPPSPPYHPPTKNHHPHKSASYRSSNHHRHNRQMKKSKLSFFGAVALRWLCRVPIDILKENTKILLNKNGWRKNYLKINYVYIYSEIKAYKENQNHFLEDLLSHLYKCLGEQWHGIQTELDLLHYFHQSYL